jgi:hypothetical protein
VAASPIVPSTLAGIYSRSIQPPRKRIVAIPKGECISTAAKTWATISTDPRFRSKIQKTAEIWLLGGRRGSLLYRLQDRDLDSGANYLLSISDENYYVCSLCGSLQVEN